MKKANSEADVDYKHSELFARLKVTTESIPNNLSSYQYLATMDELVYNAVYAIVDSTKYVDLFLAKVLAWQTLNPRRKASSVGRPAMSSYITLFFLADSTAQKMKVLKKIKLDRGILLEMIRRWLLLLDQYIELVKCPTAFTPEQAELCRDLSTKVSQKPDTSLFAAYKQAQHWYGEASQFKLMVMEKYTRLALTRSQSDYVQLNGTIELDEAIQTYMFAVSKAIDKCDTDKGVLTTHVQHWFMSAKNNVVAAAQRVHEEPLEDHSDLTIEDLDLDTADRKDTIDRVREVARLFDPQGYARLSLGILECLTPQERQVLHTYQLREHVEAT